MAMHRDTKQIFMDRTVYLIPNNLYHGMLHKASVGIFEGEMR